ncbi:TPA: exodeoxyribonuclease VII large subunit [bacterium]|nr:exodeoxyribonuclease VII large subunit [bacterium]
MSLFETQHIYKVSELTEVSNLSRPFSGHLYFKLKDAESQIDCAIFRPLADRVKFDLEDGISILLQGRLTVYEPRGNYQIIGNRVEPIGLGALQLAFEQLKKKLGDEGLFDFEHKKPLPFMPRNIGVITSATGAAIRDILTIIRRRFYNVHILIHPVSVQGDSAPREIAEAIENMNRIGGLDVLIIGRGGGSIEDLWAFNAEIVARSIYASEIPIISAVGHEIDFTIADFVADYRAPTPSAAAEIVVPNKVDLIRTLDNIKSRLYINMENHIELTRSQLENTQSRLKSADIRNQIRFFQQKIDYITQRLFAGMTNTLRNKKESLGVALAKLNALSPLSILQDGYSITRKIPSKNPIKSINDASLGDEIEVRLKDGSLICDIKQIIGDDGGSHDR